MPKWKMYRNSQGKPIAWEVNNPTRLDVVSLNDKAAQRRGGSRVIVKGERKNPSPQWHILHGLPLTSPEVRSYHFRYGSVNIAVNQIFPTGTPIEDVINYLSLDPNGWDRIDTIWWQY